MDAIIRARKLIDKLQGLNELDIRREVWKRKANNIGTINRHDITRDKGIEEAKE